jgi:hypothetical protein
MEKKGTRIFDDTELPVRRSPLQADEGGPWHVGEYTDI